MARLLFPPRGFLILILGALPILGFASAPAQGDAAGARYTLTDLGMVKGFVETYAVALNADGVVVGQIVSATYRRRAMLYRSDKIRALIKGEKGTSTANDVNSAGVVAGFAVDSGDPAAGVQATIWDGEEATALGTLGGTDSYATAINDDGTVVGYSAFTEGDFRSRPFSWSDGELTELPLLATGETGRAMNLNAAAVIVGASDSAPFNLNGLTPSHAVVWENGKITDLGSLGGDTAQATGINAAGQIVGGSTLKPGQFQYGPGNHAVLWVDGKSTDLGTLAKGEFSLAVNINATGQIVGYASHEAGDLTGDIGQLHAVLWNDGEILDLNEAIAPVDDLVLEFALDINDSGVIVVQGRVGTVVHSYLLTPIES